MLRLHYFAPTCSLVTMVALELAAAPYEAVIKDLTGDRTSLRALNPLGKLPVLETDDGVITDTIAIIYWLSTRFPDAGLLPADPAGLTVALSRMAWFGSHLHIMRRRYSRPDMFGVPAEAADQMRAVARPIYWDGLVQTDTWIGLDGLGEAGVEAYALLFYHWAVADQLPVSELPHFTKLVERMKRLDGVRRALELHASPLLGA